MFSPIFATRPHLTRSPPTSGCDVISTARATSGEKDAAGAAADRIGARLGKAAAGKALEEIRFSVPDIWSRQLFIALCRRRGISPFRYRRMHRQTVVVKAPRCFVERVLWPEFKDLSAALSDYLAEITEKLIREEMQGETQDAEEHDEPPAPARKAIARQQD